MGQERRAWLRSRTGMVLLGFITIIGFFLLTEHRAHLFGILPYLLLLSCPLLHWLMHGGHRNHDGSHHGSQGGAQT